MWPQERQPTRPGGIRKRVTESSSACSQRAACKELTTRNRDPLNVRARLNCAAAKRGKEGGTPHPAARTHGTQPGNWGGPYMAECAPRARPGYVGGSEPPHPEACVNRAWAGERGGHPEQDVRNHRAQTEGGGGGDPPERQRAHLVHGMQEREEGEPLNYEDKEGEPLDQRALPVHGMQERGGGGPLNQEDNIVP